MDLRRLLPDVKTWTLREIACAAGLVAVSAGAGYWIYRSLRGGSAPPEHTQPPHEPEDVLEDNQDTPSVIPVQVVELNLQLLSTEPHSEPSAVVQDVVDVQPASEALFQFLPNNQVSTEAEFFRAQVVELNLQLLLTEPRTEPSAVVQIHHYNFVDVFFELLDFSRFTNGSLPKACEGGFLERLFALIGMRNVDESESAAGIYFTVLIDHITALCEVLFSQRMELHSDPAALASAVSCLLRQHIETTMDNLERL